MAIGGPQKNAGDVGNFLSQYYYNIASPVLGGADNTFAPTAAPIQQGFTQDQINQAYQQSQVGLQQQQALLEQLQNQNGIGNQSQVFQQQQQLAGQLQNQANGQGPNPAQAMLANTTGQNAAQQAALMGSQRGASSNVGLMARQVGMQGGAIQQQAAGQGAALQAQQQIAAQQQLQQQQTQMAGLAGNQVNQLAGTANSYNQFAQQQYGTLQNANANYNQTLQSGYNANNKIGADVSMGNQKANAGIMNSIGGALASIFNQGGQVPGYAHGGPISRYGQQVYHGMNMRSGGPVPGKANVPGDSPKNDTVPAKLSPGEIVIPRSIAQGKDAPKKAAAFVAAVLAKNKRKK